MEIGWGFYRKKFMIINNDSNPLFRALKFLEENNFLFDGYETLDGGRNSNCWKVYNNKKSFCLKFYKDNSSYKRKRFDTEKNFLELLYYENFSNVPKLICQNRTENWTLLEWVNGVKIKKPNKDNWDSYINFLINLQKLQKSAYKYKIRNAAEACFEIPTHYKLIISRN